MELTDKQTELRSEYQMRFYSKVQELTQKRKKLRVTQFQMSRLAGCSERKIQLFENYKSLDYYLIFIYESILN